MSVGITEIIRQKKGSITVICWEINHRVIFTITIIRIINKTKESEQQEGPEENAENRLGRGVVTE